MAKDRFKARNTTDRLRAQRRENVHAAAAVLKIAKAVRLKGFKENVQIMRTSIILNAALRAGVFKGDITKVDRLGAWHPLNHPVINNEINRRKNLIQQTKRVFDLKPWGDDA